MQEVKRGGGSATAHRTAGDGGARRDATVRRTAGDEVSHEGGGLLYLQTIALERFTGGLGAVHLFSKVDVVGLLPDEERASVRRGLARPGISHLHPAESLEALTTRYLLGYGISHTVIPSEHLLDELRTVPEGEVDGVPPRHLQMGATEPGVIGEACLLRRHAVGAVDLGEVLGENDTAFQLMGAGIGAGREVDDGTLLPPAVPGLEDSTQLLVVDEGSSGLNVIGDRRKVFGLEGKDIAGSRKLEAVVAAGAKGSVALPGECQVVAGAVDDMLDKGGTGRSGRTAEHTGSVAFGLVPVGGCIGMLARGIREADSDTGAAALQKGRLDAVMTASRSCRAAVVTSTGCPSAT